MSKGVYVALSGAVAQEVAVEATAGNVANATSPGFQRLRPVFRQALANAMGGDRNLRYVAVGRTAVDTAPGTVRSTGRPLDVALPEGAYLSVSTPRGERFTRAGSITLAADGSLRIAGGQLVGEGGQPIRPAKDGGEVRVEPDGTLRQGTNAIGKLRVVTFERPDALEHEGAGLLVGTNAGAQTVAKEPLEVGALEESNAQPVVAMTELMTATRTFEAFQRVLDSFGEVDRKLLTTVPGAFE